MKEMDEVQPALLTRTQIDWLQDKIKLSDGYQRKIKSDISSKIRIFNELEFPLLVKSGLTLLLLIVRLLQLIVT